jgi:hypothetical protein
MLPAFHPKLASALAPALGVRWPDSALDLDSEGLRASSDPVIVFNNHPQKTNACCAEIQSGVRPPHSKALRQARERKDLAGEKVFHAKGASALAPAPGVRWPDSALDLDSKGLRASSDPAIVFNNRPQKTDACCAEIQSGVRPPHSKALRQVGDVQRCFIKQTTSITPGKIKP